MKSDIEPHDRYDLSIVRKCGARTRAGTPCQQPGMKNGRCRLHGGKSTGPRTPEGLERSRKANWKHGMYSQEEKAIRKKIRALIIESKELDSLVR